jgi:alpha-1,3-glucan synthase
MHLLTALAAIPLFAAIGSASPYRDDLTNYNLNVNPNAQSPLDYQSNRPDNKYTPSPDNWRALPAYTILMDKFADGDPSNNDFFGTMYESDWRETQLRFGGDLQGLQARLDYLQGMGIKLIFVSGTPFLNMMWEADSVSHTYFPCCISLIQARLLPAGFHRPRPSLGHYR